MVHGLDRGCPAIPSWTLLGRGPVILPGPATREAPLRVQQAVQQQAAVGLG